MSAARRRRTSRWYHDPFVRWTSGFIDSRTITTTNDARQPLPKAYRPSEVEGPIYERWLAADVFAPDGAGSMADPGLPPFTIIQPPPNVTGSLHLGHAQRTAVEDLMIRHARMRGHPTLFLPGLDHASIAAQFVLDGILAREGESRQTLGRERYLERMRAFSDSTKPVMLGQQRRVGASADWGRLRYTMDDVSARAVRVAFERLYRDGLAYRTEALINWCPGCLTSVSDLEVVSTPETGSLWSIRYHLIDEATGLPDPDETVTVATTRPETLLGDTGVAVHPDDERYAALIGRRARIPFVERDVPVVADEVVDRTFGTGAVKITPAHDADDYATGKRHGLSAITVLADDASVANTGTEFDGLDRYEARRRIVAALTERGDLAGERPHEMIVGRCQRSNDVLEPRLKTQWFIRTEPLAARALEATRSARTRILPQRFEKTWEHWLTNIRDWNVSRQLWWGHRIPAWYCPDGHVTVSSDEAGPTACEACGRPSAELTQDPDIFDTWFSSGLWPFSTLGWPEDTSDYRAFYPTSVMETGYDIIFFWVARMMMLGLHLTDREPFHTVYLSGLIRDPEGQKMSKTKGNVVDPLGVIDETGADALRFAVIHGAAAGHDQRFGRAKLENARNFANKLWNATRFVVGARPDTIPAGAERRLPSLGDLGPAERWMLSRVDATTAAVDAALADYAFGEVTRLLYDAIWNEFCDWGLELAKVRLADKALPAAAREATWWALVEALDSYLRLLHPVMPFVTEWLWSAIPHRASDPELLIVARWPAPAARDVAIESEVEAVLELIRGLRNARAEAGIEPAALMPTEVVVPEALGPTFESLRPAVERLGRARPLERRLTREALGAGRAAAEGDLTIVAGQIEAIAHRAPTVSATGSDARSQDRARLERELQQAREWLGAARERLSNEAFVRNAPPAVVEGARARE
ncbi:MAG TPA: valine--tRNA ligase, partial [Candidatus Limnocylindrales bacterium]|nr:valine--tRNA ligase [Candidatus Limnocylindrales bacterium]